MDAAAIQLDFIPALLVELGTQRWIGLVINWTSFGIALPAVSGGGTRKYQVLTIGIPLGRRMLLLLTGA